MSYKLVNNVVGWIVFVISAFVLTSTAESSGSLWDCGEFISGVYKLQVVHPPGAPLFLMLGRIFTLFASSPSEVAHMVNIMSALVSAFAVLFIFWIITSMAKRILVQKDEELTLDKTIAIMGSGVVGALACSFMDTLWFSAVEGEVYALSTFFIAIVLWALVRWDQETDEKTANRWLVFMSFMIGLSIGVHLLSLLVIPITALVYYFKKYKPTILGTIVAFFVGFVLLYIVQSGVILVLTGIAGKIEFLFVNSFGLPFNSGISFAYVLYFGALIFAIYYANKIRHADLQLGALCLLMVLIGFMSYLMVPIRASVNPPINMNAPKDVFSFLSYLNREQYGDRPLLFGPYFDARPVDVKVTGKSYYRNDETGKYEVKGEKNEYVYEEKKFFPRMYPPNNDRDEMIRLYQYWANFSGTPTFADNMTFFLKYQVGYMYWRYFMWNFAGRQDDFQGLADTRYVNGNWKSGLMFLDQARGVDAPDVPKVIAEQKARNHYYLLPFILGVIGLVFQIQRDKKHALYLILLFIITGLLLIVYSNQPPREPRERDYVLVGSFMTFCIWIGLGVTALYDYLRNKVPAMRMAGAIAIPAICFLAVPFVMYSQNKDDHNRNGRYIARDMAQNYLESCPPNAIVFTQGDNDTYPLWYSQEVEGVRPDVRIVNLSLAGVDWYLEWSQHAINKNGPVPYFKDFTPDKYMGQRREYMQVVENQVADPNTYYDLRTIMAFVLSDDPQKQLPTQGGEMLNYFPTGKFKLPVDTTLAAKVVPAEFRDRIVPELRWDLGKTSLYKFDIAVLAMLAGTDWSRPICFSNTVSPSYYQGLEKYLIQKGLVYQLVPAYFPENQRGYVTVDIDYTLDKLMTKFKYGNMDKEEMFIDENSHRLMNVQKGAHLRLAEELARTGKKEEAVKVLSKMEKGFPYFNMPYYTPYNGLFNLYNIQWIDILYRAGQPEKANEIAGIFIKDLSECMRFYDQPSTYAQAYAASEKESATDNVKRLELIAAMNNDAKLMENLKKNFPALVSGDMNILQKMQQQQMLQQPQQ